MWSRLAESELHSSLIEDQTANWPGRFVPGPGIPGHLPPVHYGFFDVRNSYFYAQAFDISDELVTKACCGRIFSSKNTLVS